MNRLTEKFDPIWVAGFMSGTSLDAVDGALLLTDGELVHEFGPVVEIKYTSSQRSILQDATRAAQAWNWAGAYPSALFDAAKAVITQTHSRAFDALLDSSGNRKIELAGVHGQTVLHRRPSAGEKGATLQLIDATALAKVFMRAVAYDFRTDDVAAGGEGAPLAPIYHSALLKQKDDGLTVVLNLGGVANITARMPDGSLIAFDTGPANGPVDEWVEQHEYGTFDKGGRLADRGKVNQGVLSNLLDHEWFSQPLPKSLDRYDFSAGMIGDMSLEDGAATLTAFSAKAVAAGIAQLPQPPVKVIACGGGRHNPALMRMLQEMLPCPVIKAEAVGWRGDSIEAEAFALLAVRTLRGLPISFPMTTGVPKPMSGGKLQNP